MNRDNKMIYESFAIYNKLASKSSKLHLAIAALKDCLNHFKADSTAPGHIELLKLVEHTLSVVGDPIEADPIEADPIQKTQSPG